MRRPGLVAKKITVRGKRGPHQRTYWVRQDQLSRLASVRRKDPQPDNPYDRLLAHKAKNPGAGFRVDGGDLSKPEKERFNEAWNHLFRRPDGTVASYDDVMGAFKDAPGPFTATPKVQVMDGSGKPVRDAYGNDVFEDGPPVTVNGASVRVDNVVLSKTHASFDVEVYDSVTGARLLGVLGMRRTFSRESDALTVTHDSFGLQKQYQGGGLGQALLRDQMEAYRKMGVSSVDLEAAATGRYVWAKMGFRWAPKVNARIPALFSGYMGKLKDADGNPYSEDAMKKLVGGLKPHEIASLRLPVSGPDGVKMVDVGRNFLLSSVPSWPGVLFLKDGDPGYEQTKRYLKIGVKP